MIDQPLIVGCGTVGSVLAISLAKSKLISQLKIYDFDVVSRFTENPSYPFLKEEGSIPKIKIVRFQCKYENPSMEVEVFMEKIERPIEGNGFVIDCRDCKSPDINADIRISLDGYMLYIDSMSKQDALDYHRYIISKNPYYIESAAFKVLEYLKNDQYLYKDFRFYNLKTNNIHILKRENLYDKSKKHFEL